MYAVYTDATVAEKSLANLNEFKRMILLIKLVADGLIELINSWPYRI